MKSKLYLLLSACCLSGLFASCYDDDTNYAIAPPTIVSVTPDKTALQYGDTLWLTATLTDPKARLANITVGVMAGERLLATHVVPLTNQNEEGVVIPVQIPFADNLADSPITLNLTLANVLKATDTEQLTGINATRPAFSALYLVTDDGEVITLNSVGNNQYRAENLALLNNIRYKIAQRLTPAGQPDYSGIVLGDVAGRVAQIGESGGNSFVTASGDNMIEALTFDAMAFTMTADGFVFDGLILDASSWNHIKLAVSDPSDPESGEDFYTSNVTLSNGEELIAFGELADPTLIYNLDFFERTGDNRFTFIGASGDYTLYYNQDRKNVLILPANGAAAPDYLLITGGGIGAPSPVYLNGDKSTCWWGFGNVRDYLIAPQISSGVYQLTLWVHAKDDGWVGLKFYDNKSWGGEKSYNNFSWTGDPAFELASGGTNTVPTSATDGVYRLTIDLNAMTVNVETLTNI
ncbi:MAG: hypothetical protein LBN29_04305 [Mediterranea sp.]|jgi:hypothetical protein|nr:hypothetical protein [Mediterranea sp.]